MVIVVTPRPARVLSFIIPAHNEERYLAATLQSIHEAAGAVGAAYEIVVVDDASTDLTAEIAAARGARVVSVAHRKISATRNSGARAALGERLVFVDADTLVNEALMRAVIEALDGGAAGGGAAVRFNEGAPGWSHVAVAMVVTSFRVLRLAAGCFIFCAREAFEAAGGFDERYYAAEEIVMSRALKEQGRFVMLREAVITSARKFEQRSVWKTLGVIGRLALGGMRGVRERRGTAFWYEDRR